MTKGQLSLDEALGGRFFASPKLNHVRFNHDESVMTYLAPLSDEDPRQALWAFVFVEGENQGLPIPIVLVNPEQLASGEESLSEAERMQRERKRVHVQGIYNYQWCGDSNDTLLIQYSGDFYHVTLRELKKAKSLKEYVPHVRHIANQLKPALNLQCSPDAQKAAFVHNNNLVVMSLTEKNDTRIVAQSQSPEVSYGLAEFVAQEEMGRYKGFWWSPDSTRILVSRVDESKVPLKTRAMIYADATKMIEQRYPSAGSPNANVQMHLVDLRQRGKLSKTIALEDEYLLRAGWRDAETPWLQTQNRNQTRVRLKTIDLGRATTYTIFEDRDDAWIDAHNDFAWVGMDSFVWPDEKDGYRRIRLHQMNNARTKVVKSRVISPDTRHIESVVAHDRENKVLYGVAVTEGGQGRQLLRIAYSTPDLKVKTLSAQEGWIDVQASKKGRAFVLHRSSLLNPPLESVIEGDGGILFEIPKQKTSEWSEIQKAQIERIEIKADDGTPLRGLLYKPQIQRGAKSPILVYVYGGPHAQVARNAWHRMQPLWTYLTQQGYGVFMLDNRGSAGRDRKFTRSIKYGFGDVEVRDQLQGVQWLQSQDWVDDNRIGVFGWSYGGYLTSALMLNEETPFAAGVAVAPVTDWKLYDTHYTERYMGNPSERAKIYAASNLVGRASRLNKPLFLIHGMADDNVLFEHTLKLTYALQEAQKPFDFMAYPGRAHGLRGENTHKHVFNSIVNFLNRHLLESN